MRRWCWLVLLGACADARDLFRPYVPNDAEVAAALALPRPAARVDAAIVLGCPANPDGTASLCERCRVEAAVREIERGAVAHLIFSGGAAHSPHVEADVMGDLALTRGVPPERVLREGRALTTWQNLRYATRLMTEHDWRTVLFISTADHLPRVRRIAHFYGIADAQAAYVACDRAGALGPTTGTPVDRVLPPPASDDSGRP